MIFEEQISRKPDHYPWAQEFIEAMHTGFWTDKEFSFSSDIQDFNVNLDENETPRSNCITAVSSTSSL